MLALWLGLLRGAAVLGGIDAAAVVSSGVLSSVSWEIRESLLLLPQDEKGDDMAAGYEAGRGSQRGRGIPRDTGLSLRDDHGDPASQCDSGGRGKRKPEMELGVGMQGYDESAAVMRL